METALLQEIKRIKSIAEIGLLYCTNEFDKERYTELKEISLRMFSALSGQTVKALNETFALVEDYPTPKVDVRGLILSPDKEILLVKESTDNKWTLPGGWADIGFTPKEMVIKECREECGINVLPIRLLAVFDKEMHAHPPQPHYVYKLVFLCEPLTFGLNAGFDMLDAAYFTINNLPQLSEDRLVKHQLQLVYDKVIANDWETYFD